MKCIMVTHCLEMMRPPVPGGFIVGTVICHWQVILADVNELF